MQQTKTDRPIKMSVLRKLPPGRFIKVEKIKDMDGNLVECVLLRWMDVETICARLSYFSVENGEYISEEIE